MVVLIVVYCFAYLVLTCLTLALGTFPGGSGVTPLLLGQGWSL